MTLTHAINQLETNSSTGKYNGYGRRPIPHELDDELEALISAFAYASTTEQHELSCISESSVRVLLAFAERMSSLAVRTQNLRTNEIALTALGLANIPSNDRREAILIMPLIWRTAELLGTDPKVFFQQNASRLHESARSALIAFANREPSDRSLECMGYEESADRGGFRYRRTW